MLTLTPEELIEVTGYRLHCKQLLYFQTLGVPAHRRPDGTVSVCRQHYLDLKRVSDAPSSPRPRLRSDDAPQASQSRLRKARLVLVR